MNVKRTMFVRRAFLGVLIGALFLGAALSSVSAAEVPQDEFRHSTDWVKYRVVYEFSYESASSISHTVRAWTFSIDNFTPSVHPDYALMQESNLISLDVQGADVQEFDEDGDIYGNRAYYFEKDFAVGNPSNKLSVRFEYEVTLHQVQWIYAPDDIGEITEDLDVYWYTQAQPYAESNETKIIEKSNQITEGLTDPQSKARAIHSWVANAINYTVMDEAIGASAVFDTREGDCSEYSSLMVALLRAQGIPARKVLGLVFVDPSQPTAPYYRPQIGHEFAYEEIPGHAWVQYYLPNIGWVVADPTWKAGGTYATEGYGNFFDEVDFIHLTTGIGDWFGEGIDPDISFQEGGIPEMGLGPIIMQEFEHPGKPSFSYDLNFEFKILDANVTTRSGLLDLFNLGHLNQENLIQYGIILIVLVGVVGICRKITRKKSNYDEFY